MAVYLSFHYDRDAARVQQILNMGVVENQKILNAQDWEQVKKRGTAAIETWIDEQMKYKSAVVVLIGQETATRPWVIYEIEKAWNDKRPLVGVRIHGLAPLNQTADSAGSDPFAQVKLQNGQTAANYVPVYTPSGADSKSVYASISENFSTWVDSAYRRT